MSKDLFKQFNDMYFNFLTFLKKHSVNDPVFHQFYKKSYLIKQTNIKLFIRGWYDNISSKYYDLIMSEDTSSFLQNEFSEKDISDNTLLKYIQLFQAKNLEMSVVDEFVGFIKELTTLSYLYFK
jgi:hypothetical protein